MKPDSVLTVHPPSEVRIKRDSTTEVRIGVTVADGYHVQANPASDDFLIPLQVRLRPAGGVRVGERMYPRAKEHFLGGMPKPLLTYGGTFEVCVPLEAQGDVLEGKHVLTATIRYQACDSRACLFPARLRFQLPIEVLPDSADGAAL